MKIKTWTDVDEAVKQIGLLTIQRDRLEGKLNVAIAKAKDLYGAQMGPLDDEVATLTEQLSGFCNAHRPDMDQAKQNAGLTRKGIFGKVAFRKCPPAIKLLKKAEKVLLLLRARDLAACIRTVEEPNLEAMHALPDDVLAGVGARRQPSEKFEVKPDYKMIPKSEAAA